MANPIIETDLGQVLNEISQKLNRLSDDVNELKIGQARANEKLDFNTENIKEIKYSIEQIKAEQKNLNSDVADLKGAKSLVLPIVVAVITSILSFSNSIDSCKLVSVGVF